jgi:FAD/FMN-containing dehydrogenase
MMTSINHFKEQLARVVEGEVRFDPGSRALYATDASNYRMVPIGIVIPRHAEDVIRTVQLAHENRIPILPRGGGTALAGQTVNAALVLDFSKYMNKIEKIDPDAQLAEVEPGVVPGRRQVWSFFCA